jgi:hypothetical protein
MGPDLPWIPACAECLSKAPNLVNTDDRVACCSVLMSADAALVPAKSPWQSGLGFIL